MQSKLVFYQLSIGNGYYIELTIFVISAVVQKAMLSGSGYEKTKFTGRF